MNKWRHSICTGCWKKEKGQQVPHRLVGALVEQEQCCFCGIMHESGIYVRENWAFLRCRGESGVHAEEKLTS